MLLGRGTPAPEKPALRVGIHTGLAVVSASPNMPEPVVLGTTLDVALRLQAAAAPGTVVISAATRSLVRRRFTTEPLAPLPPLGGAGRAVRPLSASARRARPLADLGFDLAPLVGRARELDQLTNRWEQARARHRPGGAAQRRARHRQVAAAARAARAGRRRSPGERACAGCRCTARRTRRTRRCIPVVTLLQRMLESEPGGTCWRSSTRCCDRFSLSEAVPLFASLLDLPAAERPSLPPMPPERQREETLEALVALVLAMTEARAGDPAGRGSALARRHDADLARAADRSGGDRAAAAGDDDPAQHPRHPVGIAGPGHADRARRAQQRRTPSS